MYKIKKAVSVMLVFLLLGLLGNSFVYGESTIDTVKVSIGKVTGTIGQEVVVPINFTNVPSVGINNCDFRLEYDADALEFVSVNIGDILPDPDYFYYSNRVTVGANNKNIGKILFFYNDATQGDYPINSTGYFAGMRFKIKSTATTRVYSIYKNPDDGCAFSEPALLKNLNSEFTNGSVAVFSTEMLRNPSFTTDATGWTLSRNTNINLIYGWNPIEFHSGPAGYSIYCTNSGTSIYDIMFYSSALKLNAGKTYVLTFWAKSTKPFIIPGITLSPWSNNTTMQTASIDTTWVKYSLIFKCNTTDSNSRLQFNLGKSIPADTTLFIDTLSLVETPI